MPRQKKKSAVLAQAEQRLRGMKDISEQLDLGGGCTTAAVEKTSQGSAGKAERLSLTAQPGGYRF